MNIPFEKFRDEVCKHFEPDFDPICTFPFNWLGIAPDVPCNRKTCPFAEGQASESSEKEYLMVYQCHNCGTKFVRGVPMGEEAYGKGGKCSYCDTISGGPDGRSPMDHQVVGPYTPGCNKGESE